MSFIFGQLIKVMSVVLAGILMFMPGAPVGDISFSPENTGEIQLNVALLSDVHMETYTFGRFTAFREALKDISACEKDVNALVLLGDNTMNGQFTEYTMLYALLKAYGKVDNTLLAMGNHDVNQSENSIGAAVLKHNSFYNAYTGSSNDKPYYYREINGYYFIIMGSEDADAGTSSYISPAQIEWLDETLNLAAESGKPIFLFNHQPFNKQFHKTLPNGNEYWYDFTRDGMGETSDDVFEVVKKYDNVIFFSGHKHYSLDTLNVCETDGVHLVNLPNFYNEPEPTGTGFQIEAYEDYVLLRARDFVTGQWRSEHSYTINLI